jgi:hypothetical protein
MGPDQPGQELHKTPSQPIKIWMWWNMPVILATLEEEIESSQSRPF